MKFQCNTTCTTNMGFTPRLQHCVAFVVQSIWGFFIQLFINVHLHKKIYFVQKAMYAQCTKLQKCIWAYKNKIHI